METKFGSASFVEEALSQNIKTTDVYADAAPLSARAMALGIGWLQTCKRFRIEIPLIPYGGEERVEATLSRYAMGLRMPEKVIAIEYEHGGIYDMKPDLTRALATRRIALCVDLASVEGVDAENRPGFQRADDDHGGVLIWSINYFDEKREWEFAPGIAVVPRYQGRDYLVEKSAWERLLSSIKGRLGRSTKGPDSMVVMYHEMLPEICEKLGDEHRGRVIQESNMDAIWTALGLFSSFGCTNAQLSSSEDSMVILDQDGSQIPLDPFHGYRENRWSGDIWTQGSRFAIIE